MANCPFCGVEVQEGLKVCPNCSASLENAKPVANEPAQAAPVDSGSIGWAILGFLIPLAGVILFLVWRNKRPLTAKKAAIGAAAGFFLALIVNILTQMNI